MKDIVYITTNHINGKQYVGSHTTDNLEDPYLGSGILIKKAVKKYGRKNFSREILKVCENREEAVLLEEFYINENNTLIPDGYNISPYGNAAFPGHKNPMYGKPSTRKGISLSDDIKQKISDSLRGNTPGNKGMIYSEETRRKIGEAQRGHKRWKDKKHSEESRKKMSESHKGKIPSNKGIPMSEDQKKKLSKSHKGKNPFENMPVGKCIYCGKEMKMSHLNRYHNNNCKFKN